MAGAVEELRFALAGVLDEARAAVAAGREPAGSEARVREAVRTARAAGAEHAAVQHEEAEALRRLARIASVRRSRELVARELEPPPAPRRGPLRERPTVSGSLDVRRGEGFRLAWGFVPAVTEWEVRLSERPDARSDYVERETRVLPGEATGVEVPLGDAIARVNVLGRGRGGRLVRRALVSGLTRESWDERWRRRAGTG